MKELECLNLNEIGVKYFSEIKEKLKNPVWGEWTYDYDSKCLCFRMQGDYDEYHIYLSEIKQSSQILDWIFQLNDKLWMTDDSMRDLLEALKFLLYPQENYCSFGQNKTCDANEILPTKPVEEKNL